MRLSVDPAEVGSDAQVLLAQGGTHALEQRHELRLNLGGFFGGVVQGRNHPDAQTCTNMPSSIGVDHRRGDVLRLNCDSTTGFSSCSRLDSKSFDSSQVTCRCVQSICERSKGTNKGTWQRSPIGFSKDKRGSARGADVHHVHTFCQQPQASRRAGAADPAMPCWRTLEKRY